MRRQADLDMVRVFNVIEASNTKRFAKLGLVNDLDNMRHVKVAEEFVLAMARLRPKTWLVGGGL